MTQETMAEGDDLALVQTALREDVRRATAILRSAGCTEVYLFGSAAQGGAEADARVPPDIDLAVRGCPRGAFFQLLGRLFCELDHPVDLVNLDAQTGFAKFLEAEGTLVRVA